jgi:hypothetical protein
VSEYDDLYTIREDEDREWGESTGYAEHADPAVIFAVIPVSSGASVAANTTYRCSAVNVINEETEGTVLSTEDAGFEILATNITGIRPTLNQDICLAVKINDRFVLIKY